MWRAVSSSSSTDTSQPRRHRGARRWGAVVVVLALLSLVLALIAPFSPIRSVQAHSAAKKQHVRVKAYYLALGDSLAFGEQPNGDYNDGYAQQWFELLQTQGSRSLTDYGCSGASTQDFIELDGCGSTPTSHDPYTVPQLDAAVNFIVAHSHQVSPVSLDIGSNNMVEAIGDAIHPNPYPPLCTVDETVADPIIANAVHDIQATILPALVQALTGPGGQRTGDLIVMNLYDPLQNVCPATVPYVEKYNQGLAEAAAAFNVPVVDVFTAFGGEGTGSPWVDYNPNLCTYTWYTVACPTQSPTDNIHPTTLGYSVIAQAFNSFVGQD